METQARAAVKSPSRPPRRWVGWVVCSVLVLVAATAVGLVAQMPAVTPPVAPTTVLPVNVKTWTIGAVPELADTFDVTAVVEPELVVNVAAEVAGRIERWGQRSEDVTWRGRELHEGDVIQEGEPIAVGEPILCLNTDLLQARFDQAQAQFEFDERELARVDGLYQRGATSKTERDDALTRRDVSRAALKAAQEELERTTIKAPISGILNKLPMELGEYAVPGQTVAEIVMTERVKVVVEVPERDVYYLAVGQTAEVRVRAPEEIELSGQITYISELADDEARTTRLEITVDNRAEHLRSGQIVSVRLTRRMLADVIMIPLASVIPLEEGRVVYVVNDEGLAERRVVELDLIKGRRVRILQGLQAGDRLIVTGHRYVGPGQAVNVVEELSEEPG